MFVRKESLGVKTKRAIFCPSTPNSGRIEVPAISMGSSIAKTELHFFQWGFSCRCTLVSSRSDDEFFVTNPLETKVFEGYQKFVDLWSRPMNEHRIGVSDVCSQEIPWK